MKAFVNKMKRIDIRFAFFMTQFYDHSLLNEMMKFISSCGDFGMSWLIVILISNMIEKTRSMSIHMLIALIAATLIGQVTIKTLVRRKRPCHTYPDVPLLIPTPSDLSFPSAIRHLLLLVVLLCYSLIHYLVLLVIFMQL